MRSHFSLSVPSGNAWRSKWAFRFPGLLLPRPGTVDSELDRASTNRH
jgi:hypothetical protein